MILQLSNISLPGPLAMHFWTFPSEHVLVKSSQGSLVSMHLGPSVFELTSPRLDDANDATKGPWDEMKWILI